MRIELNDVTRREMSVTLEVLREERWERLRNRFAYLAIKGSKSPISPGPQATKTRPSANAASGAFRDLT